MAAPLHTPIVPSRPGRADLRKRPSLTFSAERSAKPLSRFQLFFVYNYDRNGPSTFYIECMTPERFHRLEVLYDAVVEMDPDARARYIEAQCAGDEEMRRELLAAFNDDSHGFLQNAVEQAARSMAQQAEWHKDQDADTRIRPDGLPPTLQ